MKKFLALLLALVMVFALAACGEADAPASDAPASDAPASEAPASDAPASEAPADGAAGSVYYLNFKPEQDAQWQELAALYTEETDKAFGVMRERKEFFNNVMFINR